MALKKPAALVGTLLAVVVAYQLFATIFEEDRKAGARYVPIEIKLGDQVLWEGNASDDGHPDADAVWEALKEAPLRRGPDFDANAAKIHFDGDTASLEGEITIDVAYGGEITVRGVTLKKVATDKGERWMVPAEFVDKWFWSRQIKRLGAAHLKDFHEVTKGR